MCAFLFFKYTWGSLYIYSFGIVGRWFSESDPLGLLSAGVTTSFVDGFSMTMMAPCQTYAFASGTDNKHSLFHNSPVTWMVCYIGNRWYNMNTSQFVSITFICIYIYICVHFQHGPLKTLTISQLRFRGSLSDLSSLQALMFALGRGKTQLKKRDITFLSIKTEWHLFAQHLCAHVTIHGNIYIFRYTCVYHTCVYKDMPPKLPVCSPPTYLRVPTICALDLLRVSSFWNTKGTGRADVMTLLV